MKLKAIKWLSIMLILFCVVVITVPLVHAGIARDEKSLLKAEESRYHQESSVTLDNEHIGLNNILRYAVRYNARLKALLYKWKASVRTIHAKRSLDDPQLSVKTFIEEVETRVGPQKEMLSVSQKFPFPGKLFTQGQMATDISRQRFAEYQKTKLELFYEIKNAFFEYWYLYNSIRVTEENETLLKHFEEVAQSKFKSGIARNQDLLKAQVELGKIANESLTLRDYREPIVARLNALLNRPPAEVLGWPLEIDHRIVSLNENEFRRILYENNPDLERASQRLNEVQKKVRLAKLDYLPDVAVGVDYINVDKGPLNVSDNGNDAVALQFKVNVPLWYWKQKSQLDAAQAQKIAVENEKIQVERDLESKFQMAYFKLADAERQIKLYYDALIPKANQSLKASEKGYTAGRIDFLNLIDSQRILLNFQLSYYRAIRDYEQTLAELEMIIGSEIARENA